MGATQVFDCYFATDGLWPAEYYEYDEGREPWSKSDDPFLIKPFLHEGGYLSGLAMGMPAEKYPWLQIELIVTALKLNYVVVDIRKFKSHK